MSAALQVILRTSEEDTLRRLSEENQVNGVLTRKAAQREARQMAEVGLSIT